MHADACNKRHTNSHKLLPSICYRSAFIQMLPRPRCTGICRSAVNLPQGCCTKCSSTNLHYLPPTGPTQIIGFRRMLRVAAAKTASWGALRAPSLLLLRLSPSPYCVGCCGHAAALRLAQCIRCSCCCICCYCCSSVRSIRLPTLLLPLSCAALHPVEPSADAPSRRLIAFSIFAPWQQTGPAAKSSSSSSSSTQTSKQ